MTGARTSRRTRPATAGGRAGRGAASGAAAAAAGEVGLATPLARSGLTAAGQLARVGRGLGWTTVGDLLFHLPRRYDDLRRLSTLAELRQVVDGAVASARVRVTDLRVDQTWRRRVQRTTAVVEDETGSAEATWFGRRYIERRLRVGDEVVVSGKVRQRGFTVTFDDPDFQRTDQGDLLHAGRIVPVYRLTAGLTAQRLRRAIREALDRHGRHEPDYLPADLVREERLVDLAGALEAAHFPETFEARDGALRRLAFDELLALQLGMVARRRERNRSAGPPISVDDATDAAVRAALVRALAARLGRPVELTADQVAAIDAVREDLGKGVPMVRLLQGDVGSGKTAVAAYALAAAALGGRQGALIAPTDLLARQHAETVGALLEPLAIGVVLLTGSLPAGPRRKATELVASGQAGVVVGTHALLQEAVAFADLGLAVIDEQHRFGVEQRAALEAKAGPAVPHILLMTATPIPRTLGQVLYADLDVTDLRTPPAGRIAIRTGIRRPAELEGTWQRVREEAAAGHRTFVVVPLIEPAAGAAGADGEGGGPGGGEPDETDETDASVIASSAVAAESEAARLRELLTPLRVGLVHGRLKAAERDAEMRRFRDGELDVLVGTTVVEVGVDVPEATLMIVEGADRFGLAQLHQLRGRVGRGMVESYCVLVSEAAPGTTEMARLSAVAATRDGFELAETDFELRREGNVLGLAQSGLPRLRVASLQRGEHRDLAARAREHAERLLDADGLITGTNRGLERQLDEGWLRRIAAAEPEAGV